MFPVLENNASRPNTEFVRLPLSNSPLSSPFKSAVPSDSPTAPMRPAEMLVDESFEELPRLDTKIKTLPSSEQEMILRSPNVSRSPSHGSRASKANDFSWRTFNPIKQFSKFISRVYWSTKRSINPMTPLIRKWDMLVFALLCFTATVTPYEVGFLSPKLNALFYVNRCVDVAFLMDILLNMYMAYFDAVQGAWIFDLRKIQLRYIRSWLFIDVVSILPVDTISLMLVGDTYGTATQIVKTVRLLRLAKLLRMLRAGRIFRRVENSMQIDYTMLELTKFTTVTLTISHWIACLFGVIGQLQTSQITWMDQYFCDDPEADDCNPRDDIDAGKIYVVALYWAVMTLTTIGFGDVTVQNTSERLLLVVVMLVGAFQYGYIIGALGGLLSTRDERKNRYIQTMQELNSFMVEGNFDVKTKQKLREYFKYRATAPDVKAYHRILNALSPQLRKEVCVHSDTSWIDNVQLFKHCPFTFVVEVAMALQQVTFPPQEMIFREGDYGNTLYIVKKGLVDYGGEIVCRSGTIGEENLYRTTIYLCDAVTVNFTDLWMLHRDVMPMLMDGMPHLEKIFRVNATRKIMKNEVMAYTLAMQCMSGVKPMRCITETPRLTSNSVINLMLRGPTNQRRQKRAKQYYDRLAMMPHQDFLAQKAMLIAVVRIQRFVRKCMVRVTDRKRPGKPAKKNNSELLNDSLGQIAELKNDVGILRRTFTNVAMKQQTELRQQRQVLDTVNQKLDLLMSHLLPSQAIATLPSAQSGYQKTMSLNVATIGMVSPSKSAAARSPRVSSLNSTRAALDLLPGNPTMDFIEDIDLQ
ncbi:hypothetical protein CYMTET_10547 [Cymbomonas tetramitiformis]|uniref:Cyclic nucleotide-binding domain-containing protein n=1 Tax=Cymbomonas tetramitiformis TaxID=36881 RepID=A0AAE0LEC9_9CHLO|nr:hypothetical protein CYMTET_10547 [Cymbomonas tetramitiformis]